MPFGQAAAILFDGVPEWSFVVTDARPNATDEALARRSIDPPKPGNQFYLVHIEATYLGPDSSDFDDFFRLKVVGQLGVVYEQHFECYFYSPARLKGDTELFTGGTVKGWDCWEIANGDTDSLQLMLDPYYNAPDSVQRVWFSLR